MRWYKGTDPIEPDESKQILFYAGGSSLPYLGFYYKHSDRFGDWKAEDVQKWQYMEYILEKAEKVPDPKYTFYAMNLGEKLYPTREIIDEGPLSNQVEIKDGWTTDITKAITWNDKFAAETMANEYHDTEVVEV